MQYGLYIKTEFYVGIQRPLPQLNKTLCVICRLYMYTYNLLTTHLLRSTSQEGKLGIIFGKTNVIILSLMVGNYSSVILALCHLNCCLLFIRSVISW